MLYRIIKKLSYGKARIRDLKKSHKKSTGKVKVKKCQIEKSKTSHKKKSKKVSHRPQLEKVKKKNPKKVEKNQKKSQNCGSSPWRITGVKKSQTKK